ncbi:hypothetical protein [Ostreiculturibacter nitratireducens]|uniref:hypothetical protein n=1 Tax=Ostreiculturibacter nitratireducens TaxID=3075226 RepID=UPI0031B5DE03
MTVRRTLAVAAALAFTAFAFPAAAFQCPADMADIDAALASGASLSEADLARVRELRAEGEELHAAGNHQASVDALHEAKRILGLE